MNCIPERFTTIINIFGGPGIGKSTAACAVYYNLKMRGISCEYVPEFAKELVYKNDLETLENQFYVSAVQYERIRALIGKVVYIITDSPVLQGLVYDTQKLYGFDKVLNDIHDRAHSINILLRRDESMEYSAEGRVQTGGEALWFDKEIENMLRECGIHYASIPAGDSDKLIGFIFDALEVRV